MDFIVSLLYVLERVFELIIEFGDAWSAPLVAMVIGFTAWKFRIVIGSLASRLERFRLGDSSMEFQAENELLETERKVQTFPNSPGKPSVSQ